MLTTVLTIIEMVLGALLIVVILLQQKGAGLGATFGGGGGVTSTRRGADLFLFRVTIVLAILFFGVAFALLLI
jgi:preprotein translocase subunit SecG